MHIQIDKYIISQFFLSFLKVITIFTFLVFFINLGDEFNFFKKETELKFIDYILLALLKVPSILLNIFPFIALFSGIFFFLKMFNNNEIIPLRSFGFSNLNILLIPGITSFFFGYFIIFFFQPFSSVSLKNYENLKKNFIQNKNLIFFNQTGTWLVDEFKNFKLIIRIEKFDKDLKNIENITIHKYDNLNNFIERIDSQTGVFEKSFITLFNAKLYKATNNKMIIKDNSITKIETNINPEDLKSSFKNPDSVSLYNLKNEIIFLNKLGYNPIDLSIKYKKIFTLPIFMFAMVFLSGLMILNLKKTANYILFCILGVFISLFFYFLSDFSNTLSKSGVIPLDLSVWIPIIIIILIDIIGLIQVNAK